MYRIKRVESNLETHCLQRLRAPNTIVTDLIQGDFVLTHHSQPKAILHKSTSIVLAPGLWNRFTFPTNPTPSPDIFNIRTPTPETLHKTTPAPTPNNLFTDLRFQLRLSYYSCNSTLKIIRLLQSLVHNRIVIAERN